MEIREGMKYLSGSGKKGYVSDIYNNNVEVYFNDNKSDVGHDPVDVVIKHFEKGHFQLLHYPYKVGDWVYDINDEYTKAPHNTPKITQITKINELHSAPRYYVNNEDSGVTDEYFQKEYRPCFDYEIPKQKIKKESMTYLIKFLKKRGII
jgi:hypothetical protein